MIGLYEGSSVDHFAGLRRVSVVFDKIFLVGRKGSHVVDERVVMVSDCNALSIQFDE